MVDFHLARMQYRATHVAGRTFEKDHFFSQIYVSVPVFITKPEAFKCDNLFAYDRLFFGVGVVLGFCHIPLGLIRGWQYQCCCFGTEGLWFSLHVLSQYYWYLDLVFLS